MRPLIAALAFVPSVAMAELVTFSLPAPVSAFSGEPGYYFHLPLSIAVPFASDANPDLVIGSADAPNPAAEAADVRAAWERAYLSTPHGSPVTLQADRVET